MKQMKKEVMELLNIVSPSGKEQKVVNYLKPRLEQLCDKVWLDSYGNLLAEKVVGNGEGATIILSAHMDSVNRYEKGRKVVELNGTISSTKGILGADDKAGLAIILAVLRNIELTSFQGKIKVAFSREEEIGCVGSNKIDEGWIKESNLAIVVDRRGNSDVVVGTFGQAFCSNEVGRFFENCSAILDMDWKAVEGGISDAVTFSGLGVNSVNLSAGYRNEHTDKEYLVLEDMRKTVNLILQALALVNNFVHTFGEVPTINDWVDGYKYDYYGDWYDGFGNDFDMELVDIRDTFGTVVASIVDGHVCINQKYGNSVDEVFISPETFEKIAQAYYMKYTRTSKVIFSTDVRTAYSIDDVLEEKHRVKA